MLYSLLKGGTVIIGLAAICEARRSDPDSTLTAAAAALRALDATVTENNKHFNGWKARQEKNINYFDKNGSISRRGDWLPDHKRHIHKRNFLCLTGDHPPLGDNSPEARTRLETERKGSACFATKVIQEFKTYYHSENFLVKSVDDINKICYKWCKSLAADIPAENEWSVRGADICSRCLGLGAWKTGWSWMHFNGDYVGFACDQCRGHGKARCYGTDKVSPSWYGYYLKVGREFLRSCTPTKDRKLCAGSERTEIRYGPCGPLVISDPCPCSENDGFNTFKKF